MCNEFQTMSFVVSFVVVVVVVVVRCSSRIHGAGVMDTGILVYAYRYTYILIWA